MGAAAAMLGSTHAVASTEWPSAEWYVGEVTGPTNTWSRTADWDSHPVFLEYFADNPLADVLVDPYRLDWEEDGNGQQWDFSFENRYGVELVGEVYAPPEGFVDPLTERRDDGPYPTILLDPYDGETASQVQYQWLAQGLAEHGYVVVAYDPQSQGASPAGDYGDEYDEDTGECREYVNGIAWRRPQEAGVREHGACPGWYAESDPVSEDDDLRYTAALGLAATGFATHNRDESHEQTVRLVNNSRHMFGLFDLVDFVVDGDEAADWRRLIDVDRVGTIGHSAGADSSMVVASYDDRVDAAVAIDGTLLFPEKNRDRDDHLYRPIRDDLLAAPVEEEETVVPRAPTLLVGSEVAMIESNPRLVPDPDDRAQTRNGRRLIDAGVDAMTLYVRDAPHDDWAFQAIVGTRYAQRVTFHYALAWFDRYVRAGGGPVSPAGNGDGHGAAVGSNAWWRKDALRRLSLTTFDASADLSSIGLGRWVPTEPQDERTTVPGHNEPYKIAGTCVSGILSPAYHSFADIDGLFSEDLRARGCADGQ